MSTIQVKNITKAFGALKALDNVTVTFEENRIYGLLGRNGAGKTTLLNLMTNKLFATEGEILVDGLPAAENDEALGRMFMMGESSLCPESMRVKTAFTWAKEFYPSFDLEYANALCAKFGLNPSKKTRQLSTGYGSIFKIVLALASGAPVLIFDEPVLGLDANHRELFYSELLRLFAEKPFTAILSTHLIDEVADVIEQAVIIKDGRIELNQSVEELLARAHAVSGEGGAVDSYAQGKHVLFEQSVGKFKTATILDSGKDAALAERLGVELSGVELQKLFIHMTNA